MKVLITNKQLELLRENAPKEFTCEKCDHSWVIEKKDNNPYLCHMCGYDSKKKKINHEELESFWKNHKEEEIEEKWSEKYKKSINCNNPKGFSQRAHCQGRKKRLKESKDKTNYIDIINNILEPFKEDKCICDINLRYDEEDDMYSVYLVLGTEELNDKFYYVDGIRTYRNKLVNKIKTEIKSYLPIDNLYVGSYGTPNCDWKPISESKNIIEVSEETDHGFKIDEIKVALKIMSDISETFGEGIPLEFKLHSYKIAISKFTHVPILNLFIDVNRKNGEPYQIEKDYIHPISMELLGILETLKLYSTIKMKPPYNFHFNKRSLENHKIV